MAGSADMTDIQIRQICLREADRVKILVIGTGKVGSLLIEQLAQEGHEIVAIDNNEKKVADIQNELDVLCLVGNAIDRAVLSEAGVSAADLVIAATDSDEVNMLCCLLSKSSELLIRSRVFAGMNSLMRSVCSLKIWDYP